ncbi:TonB family protein [Moorena sp. SIO3B2]|uniref:TonB family protein n=1 Tax=Moorena sp. SIO3B2 TaxID=2607827 RepID=UPI0013CD93CC|nr:TonB family protein [Moorena sp. SIO3B2]NEP34233.1 TonB family protein [Moorena sp. SIO3B2]
MSDASLIKNIPEMLSHPLVISVTASLGVHMLIVPILGDLLKNQKPKEDSMVQVLELSPQQLSRVPKSAAPPLTLPALPNAKTPTKPSIPSLFNPFPPPPPPLPSIPALKPLKIPKSPPLRSLPIKPLPSIGKYPLPLLNRKRPIITRGSFPIQQLPPKPRTPLPAPPPRPNFTFDTESLNPGSFQTGSLPVFGNSTNQIPDRSEFPNQQPPVSVTPPPPPPQFSITPPPSEPTKPAPPSAVAIARQRQNNLVAQVRMRRKQLKKDVSNTSDEEARKNLVEWMALVKDTLPKKEVIPAAITVSGTYPKDACIKKLEGTTVFGILVGANGEVTNAQLIQSAGYGILNQQALEDIQFRKFNNKTGATKPYQVKVAFDYDQGNCPSLSVFQETANQPVPAKPNTVSGENAAVNNPVIVVPKPETPSNNSANNNSTDNNTDNNRTVSVPVKPNTATNTARENSSTKPRTISVPVRDNTSSQDSTPKPRRVSVPVRDNTSTQENTPKPRRVSVPVRDNTSTQENTPKPRAVPVQENTPKPRAVPVQQNTPSQENTPKPRRVLVPVRDNTPSQENTAQENTTNTTAVPVKPAQGTGNPGKESVPAAATEEQNSQEDKACKFKSRSARRRNRIDSFTTPSSRSCK